MQQVRQTRFARNLAKQPAKTSTYDGYVLECVLARLFNGILIGAAQLERKRIEATLLQLWKESCRHIQLDESSPIIAETLRAVIPFERLMIRVVDEKTHHLVTIAEVPSHSPASSRSRSLDVAEHDQLLRWCRSDRVLKRGKRQTGVLGLLLSEELKGDVIALPLSEESSHAALILFAAEGYEYDMEQVELAQRLSEPIAVAVANHHRIHEMASLREAAEADKGALLRRLGRTDLGDHIIGESTGLQMVMDRVQLVAASDAPVIVLGETGSGKELIARALHTRGTRRDGPFIRVNCGAIPHELIDSQLFGHEKGAFTGADQSRQGWFERADGGTLFLDEIGELPLDAQVRFLRVLQDGFVERVGSDKSIHVDVRVVAATHRDLASMVANGKFREDLWYRVAVFPILLPPLRERRGDIPELAFHFAERAALRFGLSPVEPTTKDIELLQSYQWPGNIRELGAVIDRAAILGNGRSLEVPAALGLGNRQSQAAEALADVEQAQPIAVETADYEPSTVLHRPAPPNDLSIEHAMRCHIEFVLEKTKGKVEGQGGAAELLEINPHTLRARMRKLKIKWAKFRQFD